MRILFLLLKKKKNSTAYDKGNLMQLNNVLETHALFKGVSHVHCPRVVIISCHIKRQIISPKSVMGLVVRDRALINYPVCP